MAELYTFKPLFPGSSEMDQFQKISQILGKPAHDDWPDAKRLADRKLFTLPEHSKIPLQNVIPRASPDAVKLMELMLSYNPKKRPKPSQVLSHEFFHPKTSLTSQISPKTPNPRSSQDTTADSGKQRVESIIIGQSNLQIVTKMVEKTKPGNSMSPERPVPLNIAEENKRKSIDPASVLAVDKTPDQKQQAAKYGSEVKQNSVVAQMSRNNRLEPISIEKPAPVNITKVNGNDRVSTKDKVASQFAANAPVQGNHLIASQTIQHVNNPKIVDLQRNANVQSVMDESSPLQQQQTSESRQHRLKQQLQQTNSFQSANVNLRKTFNAYQSQQPSQGQNPLNQSVVIQQNKRSSNVSVAGHQTEMMQQKGNLNDSIVLIKQGTDSKNNNTNVSQQNGQQPQRKSIQQIMNTVFDDSQSIPKQNASQLSQQKKAGSQLQKMQNNQLSITNEMTPRQNVNSLVNRVTGGPNNSKSNTKPQYRVGVGVSPDAHSSSQIQQIINQREVRNNSVIAQHKTRRNNGGSIGATHSLELPGSLDSTIDQANTMNNSPNGPGRNNNQLVAKQTSSKWLPQVKNEKKPGAYNQQNNSMLNQTTKIQVGTGDAMVVGTNQVQSQMKMYQNNAPPGMGGNLRVTQQVGQTSPGQQGAFQPNGQYDLVANASKTKTNNFGVGNGKQSRNLEANNKNVTELQYKIQLPEIMQQQQAKINTMKKQHELRFQNKRPLQLTNQAANSLNQTRSKNFNLNESQQFQPVAQSMGQQQTKQRGVSQNQQIQQQQFMQTMQAVVNNNTGKPEGGGNGGVFINNAGGPKVIKR